MSSPVRRPHDGEGRGSALITKWNLPNCAPGILGSDMCGYHEQPHVLHGH